MNQSFTVEEVIHFVEDVVGVPLSYMLAKVQRTMHSPGIPCWDCKHSLPLLKKHILELIGGGDVSN